MTNQLATIQSIVDTALAGVADQLLVHKGRCVDIYLDLYAATDDLGLRWSLTERLDEIRHLSLVDVAEFRADVEAVLAIASGTAFAVPTSRATVAATAAVAVAGSPVPLAA